jgi:hypothetical protein
VRGNGGYEDGTEPSPDRASGYPGSGSGATGKGDGVAETTEQEGTWTCERCGAVRPADWTCSCGGEGKGERVVPEGWDPELTRTSRPRLGLVARPEPEEAER